MGCLGCTTCGTSKGAKGCNSNGGCGSGGCNRLNTYDWLSALDIVDVDPNPMVEVSFKNGARKQFFRMAENVRVHTGEMVAVETGSGYDIGKVSLSGELVGLQMKRRRVDQRSVQQTVLRRANERDLERLQEARESEQSIMVRARAISRTLGLDMKIGDVEMQGDKRKATFFYTADGRVDFRELIRHFAKEFKVKIEMRQIGARQESARIGGIGSCGRELCCSTWLTDFKSVSTAAARYQNLAINQAKLSGQCGRLKCCLNYELDTYLDALSDFPSGAEKLHTKKGSAVLIKTDIFKRILYYVYDHERGRGAVYPLDLSKVKEIQEMNKRGEKPEEFDVAATSQYVAEETGFVDVTGDIELPEEKRRRRKKKKGGSGNNERRPQNQARSGSQSSGERPDRNQARSDRPTNNGQNAGQQNRPDQNRPDQKRQEAKGGGQNQGGAQQKNKPQEGQQKPQQGNLAAKTNNQNNQNNQTKPEQRQNNGPKSNNQGPRNEGPQNPEQGQGENQGGGGGNNKRRKNRNKNRNRGGGGGNPPKAE
jgi:cell fate regulator YaaT (PSP1 superfamily)